MKIDYKKCHCGNTIAYVKGRDIKVQCIQCGRMVYVWQEIH